MKLQGAESPPAVQPISLTDTIIYVWLGQALLLLIPWGTDYDFEVMVRNGNVVYELVRPVDVYWL